MAISFTTYKLIILFMLDNSQEAISNSRISDFVLEKDTNYLFLQQALSELVESGLLEKKIILNASFYQITEEGRNVISFFEKDLSPELRRDIKAYLNSIGYKNPDHILTPADYYTTTGGGYAVRCQIIERGATVMDLNMAVPSREAAEAICLGWSQKSQDIYAEIMEELL